MWVLGWMLSLGCVTKMVDRMTVDKIVGQAQVVGDTQMPCALGESLNHVLMATQGRQTPDLALLISNGTAAMCSQSKAWEERLRAERAKKQRPLSDAYRVAEIKDAQISAARWDSMTARRFYEAFNHAEQAFGNVDTPCPKIAERDEVAYLVALIAGTFSVLHDKQSDGTIGVPLDLLPKVARASTCLDNEKWWGVPQALQAGIWATIPGTGPADADPWSILEESAEKGSASGVRVAYALGVLLANNAGDTDRMKAFLGAHGTSISDVARSQEWAFFDQYAYEVALHQSDLFWIETVGHRTPVLGTFPVDPTDVLEMEVGGEDPFESEDPFGED
jgi:hypothetical protein